MRTVRAEIAYDGSRFHGWQRQDGFLSVQGAVEDALACLLETLVTVHGAGRTDRGVHALRQVAHFHVDTRLEDDRVRHALNYHLVDGVVINRLETCSEKFHARFSARGKRYFYLVATSRFPSPIGAQFQHWTNQSLDLAAMRDAARRMQGTHDFVAFGNAGSVRKRTVRTVHGVRVLARRERFVVVVQGNGFLYNMVRNMVGTLIDVGRGRRTADTVDEALRSGEREAVGPTAPACGLYLGRVLYPEPTFVGRDRGPAGVPGVFPA
ncbi:MAG: tRNA pseudouridine(38-40) synthase TruA [Planctomycetota bacterium]|nr:tRNA pseudouridine(38-40) synthase TruA [Planctomycetota bacterium]